MLLCRLREGESAPRVNRVAREFGIQPPSLYNHIAGNKALRLAVAVIYRRAADFVMQQVAGIEEPILVLKTAATALLLLKPIKTLCRDND